ncbi:MAG: TIGR02391 family protein [Candidatus Levybacteria bacterium]|nr:TIGR02391 family protein [Candidatus Levybacteria bacterium]
MMTGKQKLYFLLDAIEDKRVLTPLGKPVLIHSYKDLKMNYTSVDLIQLLTKLETDEKILKILATPTASPNAALFDPYTNPEEEYYYLELLPAFNGYFQKIQQEPEYQEFTGKIISKSKSHSAINLSVLHPEIFRKCQSLFEKAEYAEAVEKGFKIVRDKLRDLTGHETGSNAFGNTKLHIKGAAAKNVDDDFNEGVKFLTMAIDMFRNEKSHTPDAKIDDPQRAYEYLTLSSLAMNLLDQAEITA